MALRAGSVQAPITYQGWGLRKAVGEVSSRLTSFSRRNLLA